MEQIGAELRATNEDNGWFNLDFNESNGNTIGSLLMEVVYEVCNMLEAYRNNNPDHFKRHRRILGHRINKLDNDYKESWKIETKARDVVQHLLLSISEHGEAYEAWLVKDKKLFDEEIADIFIRLLSDQVKQHDIQVTKEIEAKHETNKGRGIRHGNKRV